VEVNIYTINWRLDAYNQKLSEWLNATMPNVKAKFIGLADYDKDITTLLVNAPETVDICLSRGPTWRLWANNGWLSPLDNIPGMTDLKEKSYASAVAAGSLNDSWYSIPWYTSVQFMYYNKRILSEAGFDHPPSTWDELVNQSLVIKQKGLCEYPLAFTFIARALRLERCWRIFSTTMTEDNDPIHWDSNLNPLFLGNDSAGSQALQFMHDIIYKWGIASEGILTMDWTQEITQMGSGQFAFCAEAGYQIKTLNDPNASQEAGNIDYMLWPDFHYSTAGDDGGFVVTQFSMEQGDDHKLAVQNIYKYISSPEWKKEMDAIPQFLECTYPEVNNDANVMAEVAKFGNATVRAQTIEFARSLALDVNPLASRTTWAAEFDTTYVIPILSNAVRGATPVEQALNDIYQGFLTLKGKYGLA
jgi:ABC-type glycerol-3-phosphate transport system substrate-binding protein